MPEEQKGHQRVLDLLLIEDYSLLLAEVDSLFAGVDKLVVDILLALVVGMIPEVDCSLLLEDSLGEDIPEEDNLLVAYLSGFGFTVAFITQ